MIERFISASPFKVRVVNLWETEIRGGCLGCFGCATTGKCVYTDGFDVFLRNTIQSADAIVYAFTIRDHSMGARFKMYDDRQICNGHRTVTMGAPTGYLISGAYSKEENVRTIVEAALRSAETSCQASPPTKPTRTAKSTAFPKPSPMPFKTGSLSLPTSTASAA